MMPDLDRPLDMAVPEVLGRPYTIPEELLAVAAAVLELSSETAPRARDGLTIEGASLTIRPSAGGRWEQITFSFWTPKL